MATKVKQHGRKETAKERRDRKKGRGRDIDEHPIEELRKDDDDPIEVESQDREDATSSNSRQHPQHSKVRVNTQKTQETHCRNQRTYSAWSEHEDDAYSYSQSPSRSPPRQKQKTQNRQNTGTPAQYQRQKESAQQQREQRRQPPPPQVPPYQPKSRHTDIRQRQQAVVEHSEVEAQEILIESSVDAALEDTERRTEEVIRDRKHLAQLCMERSKKYWEDAE